MRRIRACGAAGGAAARARSRAAAGAFRRVLCRARCRGRCRAPRALEHFTRHLTEAQRQALTLSPSRYSRARRTTAARAVSGDAPQSARCRYRWSIALRPARRTTARRCACRCSRCRRSRGPPWMRRFRGSSSRAWRALLRSLPKEARRSSDSHRRAAAGVSVARGAPSASRRAGGCDHGSRRCAACRRASRSSIPRRCPRISMPRVCRWSRTGGELGAGTDLGGAAPPIRAARRDASSIERARALTPAPWRRFEAHELPERRALELAAGRVARCFPRSRVRRGARRGALRVVGGGGRAQSFRRRRRALAAIMLERQVARPRQRRIGGDAALLLSAVAVFHARCADRYCCSIWSFAAPASPMASRRGLVRRSRRRSMRGRARAAFEARRHRRSGGGWFAQARAVRRLLDDPAGEGAC